MRRAVLQSACCGAACAALGAGRCVAGTDDADEMALIRRIVGGEPEPSPRVRLETPAKFGNGYSVPCVLDVQSPMTESDHVRAVHVLAPKNPIVTVATFRFNPRSGRASISTRIRLARSQDVLAVADMSDGTLLLGRAGVEVDTDGCA